MNFLEYIGSVGGIGAIMAVLIWLNHRELVKQMRQDRKYMEDRLTDVLSDYKDAIKERNVVMTEHTKVLTQHTGVMNELYAWLRRQNGHS